MSARSSRHTAAAVLATAMFIAASFCMVSDSSDAYEVKEGSESVYFETSAPLGAADAGRLLSDASKQCFARYAAEVLCLDFSNADIQDVAVSDLEIKASRASKVSGTERVSFMADRYSMKISFRIVCTSQSDIFSYMSGDMSDLVRYFNDGRMSPGDTITVSTGYSFSKLSSSLGRYAANSSGGFVLTSVSTDSSFGELVSSEAKGADVTFTHGSEARKASVDAKAVSEYSMDKEYSFGGRDISNIVSSMPVQAVAEADRAVSERSFEYRAGDMSGSFDIDTGRSMKDLVSKGDGNLSVENAIVLMQDLDAEKVGLYGPDASHYLFADAGDVSLSSESAMKQYLESIGRISYDYSDAEDLQSGLSELPKAKSLKITLIVCAGVCMVAIVLLTAFIMSRNKSQR